GGKVKVTAIVRNAGDAPAEDVTVDLTYTDGGDKRVIGTVALGTIPANVTVEASLKWDADEGEYVVTAYVESSSDERDASANNNAASGSVDVEGDPADPIVLVVIVIFAIALFIILAFLVRSIRHAPPEETVLPPMTWMETAQRRTPHSRSEGVGRVKTTKPRPGPRQVPPPGRHPEERGPPGARR
ncbi:MAG: hypothetical protein L0Z54_02380, partial [Thermoplasmata archaeon]|nr:hypothetical protein [Thermoplasmata archaeon]